MADRTQKAPSLPAPAEFWVTIAHPIVGAWSVMAMDDEQLWDCIPDIFEGLLGRPLDQAERHLVKGHRAYFEASWPESGVPQYVRERAAAITSLGVPGRPACRRH